jgi:BCD family chlorophyll transporter-like MFS transporter
LHTTQTAGLALATDLAPPEKRPRVVALLYVTLLAAWGAASLLFGQLLTHFSNELLIRVIQGVAVATILLNVVALWKQEAIDPNRAAHPVKRPPFLETWRNFSRGGRASRLLVVVGLGTAGFAMQDILLEPYGGEVLGLSVSQTTVLNAIWAAGSLIAFTLAAHILGRGSEPYRIAAVGALIGVLAFVAVILSAPLDATWLYRSGAGLIGFGGGLFLVGTLTAAMALAEGGFSGLALGAWGAVQATSMGIAFAVGGMLRDVVSGMASRGAFGEDMASPALGYNVVYGLEILLLAATLIVILPLVLRPGDANTRAGSKIGLDHMP